MAAVDLLSRPRIRVSPHPSPSVSIPDRERIRVYGIDESGSLPAETMYLVGCLGYACTPPDADGSHLKWTEDVNYAWTSVFEVYLREVESYLSYLGLDRRMSTNTTLRLIASCNLLNHLGYRGPENTHVIIDQFDGPEMTKEAMTILMMGLYGYELPHQNITVKGNSDKEYEVIRRADTVGNTLHRLDRNPDPDLNIYNAFPNFAPFESIYIKLYRSRAPIQQSLFEP